MEGEIMEFGLTRKELIAALVEDSIGYLTPRSAELHIESWKGGDKACFCERCQWVFGGNLQKCLESAASRWEYLAEERRQHLLDLVERVSKLDSISQTTVGLTWPTMV